MEVRESEQCAQRFLPCQGLEDTIPLLQGEGWLACGRRSPVNAGWISTHAGSGSATTYFMVFAACRLSTAIIVAAGSSGKRTHSSSKGNVLRHIRQCPMVQGYRMTLLCVGICPAAEFVLCFRQETGVLWLTLKSRKHQENQRRLAGYGLQERWRLAWLGSRCCCCAAVGIAR